MIPQLFNQKDKLKCFCSIRFFAFVTSSRQLRGADWFQSGCLSGTEWININASLGRDSRSGMDSRKSAEMSNKRPVWDVLAEGLAWKFASLNLREEGFRVWWKTYAGELNTLNSFFSPVKRKVTADENTGHYNLGSLHSSRRLDEVWSRICSADIPMLLTQHCHTSILKNSFAIATVCLLTAACYWLHPTL